MAFDATPIAKLRGSCGLTEFGDASLISKLHAIDYSADLYHHHASGS
jgi:hypothetical protein